MKAVVGRWGIAALLILFGACTARETAPPVVEVEGGPDQESWDIELGLETEGVRRARIIAPYAARFEGPDSTYARFGPSDERHGRVVVHVYDQAGNASATVEADRIDYLEQRRRFVAQGDVVVQTDTGRRLEAELLTWDEAARELRSNGFVRITTPTERLQGYRLVADESLDTYRLARITGQVEVEED